MVEPGLVVGIRVGARRERARGQLRLPRGGSCPVAFAVLGSVHLSPEAFGRHFPSQDGFDDARHVGLKTVGLINEISAQAPLTFNRTRCVSGVACGVSLEPVHTSSRSTLLPELQDGNPKHYVN